MVGGKHVIDELPGGILPAVAHRVRPGSLSIERQRLQQRSLEIEAQHAGTSGSVMTSFGPLTGKPATGSPLAKASSSTRPKVSVRLGNTKTSAEA